MLLFVPMRYCYRGCNSLLFMNFVGVNFVGVGVNLVGVGVNVVGVGVNVNFVGVNVF